MVSLLLGGNWIGLGVVGLLLLMSVLSWAIILTKWLQLRSVAAEDQYFQSSSQKDQPLSAVYSLAQRLESSTLSHMFEQSFREVTAFRARLEKTPVPEARERLMETLSRTLERTYNQQAQRLERRLPLLATISSSAPYIGLFGTVLGIIEAFQDIGTTGVTSLAVVAPGISGALVATAAGLLAAIPALIAYNLFRNRLREMNASMKNFALEITNRMDRML